jgi:hypothetical protein
MAGNNDLLMPLTSNIASLHLTCHCIDHNDTTFHGLPRCSVIIGFDEFGTRALVDAIEKSKRTGQLRALIWLPNLAAIPQPKDHRSSAAAKFDETLKVRNEFSDISHPSIAADQ